MTAATFEDRVAAARRLLTTPLPPLPGWFVDQGRAAEADAWGRLFVAAAQPALATGIRPRILDGRSPAGVEAEATLLAAVFACTPCPHLRRARAPMPAVAALGLHRVDCETCTRTWRNPPAGEDDRCDICGSRDNTWFRSFTVVFGSLVVLGDTGRCCVERIGLDA